VVAYLTRFGVPTVMHNTIAEAAAFMRELAAVRQCDDSLDLESSPWASAASARRLSVPPAVSSPRCRSCCLPAATTPARRCLCDTWERRRRRARWRCLVTRHQRPTPCP